MEKMRSSSLTLSKENKDLKTILKEIKSDLE